MPSAVEINRNIIEMEYAVRGPIHLRAVELKKQGKRVIPCNLGNPQALGQKPLTFCRQVLGLIEDPGRIERERKLKTVPGSGIPVPMLVSDYVLERAEQMLTGLENGMGAYTESKGPRFIREAVSCFIDQRDDVVASGGPRSDPEMIFLTDGASEGARFICEMLIGGPRDGIMIPIPQYPLYSATIRRCGGAQVNYYPDEDRDWNLDRSMLEDSIAKAQKGGINVRAIVVINPGNPTGAILDDRSIQEVIEFAEKHHLVIIADEVYQENLYGGQFISFARMLGKKDIPLVSLHSTSKGFHGECGHRGGYLEVRNPPKIKSTQASFIDFLLKQASVALCSNTVGQAMTFLMVSPPATGSEPYSQYTQEKEGILADLQSKAALFKEAFKQMQGVRCFGRVGAMYLFPRLERLPSGKTDFDYCMHLLEETGLVTVNGSGFGQKEGSHHLRVAFLPPKKLLEEVLPQWIEVHNRYV
jgi:aspartate/methionine/tyrosine aminotransferase